METEFLIQCPFCGEDIWIEFYPQDGATQDTIVDCEVCCAPIAYKVNPLALV
jgi:sarcosine oxidase delta subunit